MDDSEKRKAIELLKEMRNESKTEDGKSNNQEIRLNWMYKGPSDLVDREEYLLGKAIDKTFEVFNCGNNFDVVGRTGEQSNVPRRLLEKTDDIEQVDIAKKILEDPLYAIKQKEMEARKKLLNNPVKLKQIKLMLLERSKQNSSYKAKKKKKKKSEQDLNELILKKLRMFSDKEKRKALNKIMKSDIDSSSTETSSSDNKKNKKSKSKRKKSYSFTEDSDSSNESTSSSDKSKQVKQSKKIKENNKINKKKQSRESKESNLSYSSFDCERNKKFNSKKSTKKNYYRQSSCDSESESSSNTKEVSNSQDKSKKNLKNFREKETKKHEKKNSKEKNFREEYTEKQNMVRGKENPSKKKNSLEEDSRSNKIYGLMMPDGSQPDMRKKTYPELKYPKKIETKPIYVSSQKVRSLTHKEREAKLKEMMKDAKLRKEDREKNLASHRRKLALEEESKTYDDDFMRRQMLHLTSQGTMADRIKSNINNIQRSKTSMDTNFMRK